MASHRAGGAPGRPHRCGGEGEYFGGRYVPRQARTARPVGIDPNVWTAFAPSLRAKCIEEYKARYPGSAPAASPAARRAQRQPQGPTVVEGGERCARKEQTVT